MKEKVEDQWRFLFDAVYGETKAIKTQSAEAIASIKDLLNGIQDLIDGWNSAAKAKTTYNNTPVSSGGSGGGLRNQPLTDPDDDDETTVTEKKYWQAKFQGTNGKGATEVKVVGKNFGKNVTKETAEAYFKKLSE